MDIFILQKAAAKVIEAEVASLSEEECKAKLVILVGSLGVFPEVIAWLNYLKDNPDLVTGSYKEKILGLVEWLSDVEKKWSELTNLN